MSQPEQKTSPPSEIVKVPLWQLRQLHELIGKIKEDDGEDHDLLCSAAQAMIRHYIDGAAN